METEALKGEVSCPRSHSVAQPLDQVASEMLYAPVAPARDVPGQHLVQSRCSIFMKGREGGKKEA